jgi:hypothetical protein
MAYGMRTYNDSGNIEFDSTSFGGVPIDIIDLTTTAGVNNPTFIRYPQHIGRSITIIPLVSGDYLCQAHGPYEGDPNIDLNANYPKLSYWSVNTDFSPTLSTHGFVKKPTKVLVLLK